MQKGLTVKKGGQRFLNGQPFIASQVNDDPNKELTPIEVALTPTDGVIPRTCRYCFYRGEMDFLGPSGKGDCHCGAMGNLAKVLFGVGSGVMPVKIDKQPVGNYCPFWLDFRAE